MMLLFRSTFITAVSAFVMALFLFSMSASAMPQFGRPMLHALDAVTTASGPIEAVPTSAATSTGTDPDPASSSSASSTATTTLAAASTSTNDASSTATTTPAAGSTNGASRSLCGGMSVMLGVVVSGVWLVF
ncbi:hypothetical protein DFJ58DRAFT_809600 [Suillus subalutaceus]|uniref:uncharacterized protein n=1 Tax=Suillus subalutaceus TaxID=48586 RepID=UPI001B871240|nr:uncharacterized protein DFJ58DRAFT_809600 [Suillus subalutaceus]KAG1840932.1 hypothetical protein DFJ58DRAFT_809600 [Suillus subalutaceus]